MTIATKENYGFTVRKNDTSSEQLQSELITLKGQSDQLDRINKLHVRMAGVLHLTGMIEAYSHWLMPYVSHDFLGYTNSQQPSELRYFYSPVGGSHRRVVLSLAKGLVSEEKYGFAGYFEKDGYYGYRWGLETEKSEGWILLLRRNISLSEEDLQLINESMEVLTANLQRGLAYEDIYFQASCDPLTGLFNRRIFEERSDCLLSAAKRYDHPLAMISLDLDHFKSINDNMGHQKGDEVLKLVASSLQAVVRDTDLLVRFGGDEFVILLENTDLQGGQVLANRLCSVVRELDFCSVDKQKLGISAGLTLFDGKESLRDWMNRTDQLLYQAKKSGGSKVVTQ